MLSMRNPGSTSVLFSEKDSRFVPPMPRTYLSEAVTGSFRRTQVAESSEMPPLPVSMMKFSVSGLLFTWPFTTITPPVNCRKGKLVSSRAGEDAGGGCVPVAKTGNVGSCKRRRQYRTDFICGQRLTIQVTNFPQAGGVVGGRFYVAGMVSGCWVWGSGFLVSGFRVFIKNSSSSIDCMNYCIYIRSL